MHTVNSKTAPQLKVLAPSLYERYLDYIVILFLLDLKHEINQHHFVNCKTCCAYYSEVFPQKNKKKTTQKSEWIGLHNYCDKISMI